MNDITPKCLAALQGTLLGPLLALRLQLPDAPVCWLRTSLQIPNPRRIRKVRKSMSRIKCVLGERKRMKVLIRSQAAESGVEASQ